MADKTRAEKSPSISFKEDTFLSPPKKQSKPYHHADADSPTPQSPPEPSPSEPSPRNSGSAPTDSQLPPPAISVDSEAVHHGHDHNPTVHGIYWRSPAIMIGCFIFGILACIGHGVYYAHLRGNVVGVVNSQQTNIRVGSFFAFLAQISFTSSTWLSYYQWVWRAMQQHEITLRGLDAAFSAETSLLALLNPELIKRVKVGYILAIIAWSLQLPSLITPATLFVTPSNDTATLSGMVPVLGIADAALAHKFAYSTPIESNTRKGDTESLAFSGPRSIVQTITTAAASSGLILDIPPPSARSAYSVAFYGPYVLCNPANSTAQAFIEAMVEQKMATLRGTYKETTNAYYAFVPSFDPDPDVSDTVTVDRISLTGITETRTQQPGNATNELWMRFWRYKKDSNGNLLRDPDNAKIPELHYSVCQLYNATYDVAFSFNEGIQTVNKTKIDILGPVSFPVDREDKPSNMTQHSFSSVFWALTDQLVGSMGFYNDTRTNSTETPAFSSIDTQIQDNSLLGSDDLDYFFDINKLLYSNNTDETLSDQRIRDKALAKNQTLDYLIEDLCFNITISLMSDPLLAPNQRVQITHTTSVNRYAFSWQNLLLAYGLAIFAALLANALGLIAYRRNGAAHDLALSTMLSVSRNEKLLSLFPHCTHGRLPVPTETIAAPFKMVTKLNGGLSLEPTQDRRMSVCDACLRSQQSPGERRRSSLWSGRRASVVGAVVVPASKGKKHWWAIRRRKSARAVTVNVKDMGEKTGLSGTTS